MNPLPDEELLVPPVNLFHTWDSLDVPHLRVHERHFRSKAPQLGHHENFRENWGNCIKALKFKEDKAALFFSNEKKYLDENELIAPPANFYWIWDVCELDALLRYRAQFARSAPRLGNNENFMKNWENCDTAVKFVTGDLAGQYFAANPDEPLKQAVRNRRAVKQTASFATEFLSDPGEIERISAFDHDSAFRQMILGRLKRELKTTEDGKLASSPVIVSFSDKENLANNAPEEWAALDHTRIKVVEDFQIPRDPDGSLSSSNPFNQSEENRRRAVPHEMQYFYNRPEINFL